MKKFKIYKDKKVIGKDEYYNHCICFAVIDYFKIKTGINCYFITPEFRFESPLNKKKVYFDFYEGHSEEDFWKVFSSSDEELKKEKKTNPFKNLIVLREKMKLKPVVYKIK